MYKDQKTWRLALSQVISSGISKGHAQPLEMGKSTLTQDFSAPFLFGAVRQLWILFFFKFKNGNGKISCLHFSSQVRVFLYTLTHHSKVPEKMSDSQIASHPLLFAHLPARFVLRTGGFHT